MKEERTTVILSIMIVVLLLMLGGCSFNISLKKNELELNNTTTKKVQSTTTSTTTASTSTTTSSKVTTSDTTTSTSTSTTTITTGTTKSTTTTKKTTTTTKPPFTVSFDSAGGSTVKPITVKCGSKLTLPTAPTLSGYNFVKWTDKNGKEVKNGAVLACENITLRANWQKKPDSYTYTSKFDDTTGLYKVKIYKNGELYTTESKIMVNGSQVAKSSTGNYSVASSAAGNIPDCGKITLVEIASGIERQVSGTSCR